MKRFLLYACIWTPGTLAVVGFLISLATFRKVADGLPLKVRIQCDTELAEGVDLSGHVIRRGR